MLKLNRLAAVLSFMALQLSFAQTQTTILDETLLTQSSFNTFTAVNVAGDQVWNFNSTYGAVCTGFFQGQNYQNEDWLVSPPMNLSQTDDVQLSFSHTRGNAAVMNVGVAQGWYKAFATANYSGHPSTTQWVELKGMNQNIPAAWQFVSSGQLTIPNAARSQNTRIAFRYMSSSTQSAMWEIQNVKVTGITQGPNPGSDITFKITNWNTEWLGCESNGPTNENLQIGNVAQAMLLMNSDIYCIQEVSNTVTNQSIQTLIQLLGSSQWGGAIVPATTGDCSQRQAIIYKKSKVQFVNAMELNSGNQAQGNSYHYNWSNGRYPALYNVNLVVGSALVPVSLVNIHAKAEDGNAMSYTRRKGGSEGLKAILDGSSYNTKNVIVIGDFNDYLTGTTSNTCNCSVSPYNNFINDQTNYSGITKFLIDADMSWGSQPIIENIIISNELFDNYIPNSATQETTVAQAINNFSFTTSNHLPVSAMFAFSTLSSADIATYTVRKLTIYPNPANSELNISTSFPMDDMIVEIYDITGRRVHHENTKNNTIDVSKLPSGMYILKVGDVSTKFIKQ